LALGSAGEPGLEEAAFPFAPEFRVGARQGKPSSRAPADLRALFARHYLNPAESYRAIEDDWLASAGTLALQLDANTNNTSLVLAFEFIDTGEVFLFPGDAQVGNWLSWDNYTWKIQQPGGASEEVTAQELLARTRFYKVGHHGSHNATLEEKGLERMTHSDLVAMIPVNQEMARKKRWKMPWPKLFERLQEKCSSVILEDEAEQAKAPRVGRIEATSLFVDYQV
jgi:hypothetical protein